MNHKIKVTFTVCFLFHQMLFSQTITKSGNSPISGAICPSENTSYTVSLPTGFNACKISWSATNGEVVSTSGATATIKWNDTPGATGTVTATFSDCGSANEGNNGKTASKSELILSVKNQSWGSYGNSVNIDYCTKATVNISVPRMFVQGTGGIAQPPLVEVAYAWTLPSGWREVGTGRTGFFGTTTNFIAIEPIDCSKPGLVTVQGVLNGWLCNSAAASATATISLNGANPVVTVGPQVGYTGGSVCNQTPVTFYATTSVALGCITGYEWTYPGSWSFMSQSANSITLRPSGSPADSNPIRAKVNFSCGSFITSANYTPPYAQTSVSGPDLICSSASYSVLNSSGVTVSWSSSNTSIATVNSSGLVTRTGSASGQVTITATFPCAAPPNTKTIYVGSPDVGASYISGTSNTSCNIPYTYQFFGGAAGASSMEWEASAHFILGANGLNSTLTPVQSGEGYLSMKASNTCGSTYTCLTVCATGCDYGLILFPNHPCATFENCGFSLMSAYPNPTEESLTIKLSDDADFKSGDKYQVTLLDETGNVTYTGIGTSREFIIRKGILKEGRYIVQCTSNGKTILNQRIIVK